MARGFGEPGLKGEWMSLSKRYMPPIGCPLGIKLDSIGVGRTGTTGSESLRCFGRDEILLTEAAGEVSKGSGPDIESALFLRLEEEKFFLSPVAAFDANRAGDPGTEGILASLSAEVTFVRADAVDDIGSSEPMNGDELLRTGCNVSDVEIWLYAVSDKFS